MRIATWNVNSIRLRLDGARRLIEEWAPDVLCLQETKVDDDRFPLAPFEELGYRHAILAQGVRGQHGVAILSRLPLASADRHERCGLADGRHVSARLPDGLVVHSLYVPSGGDEPDTEANPKFAHKLAFLDEMAEWSRNGGATGDALLAGDLNVAPLPTDVWSHRQLVRVVSHTPVEVAKLEAWQAEGEWVDAVRTVVPPEEKLYTWWSYRARDWSASDRGRRLDHVWLTPRAAGRIVDARVLREARGWPRASDHAPVLVDLAPA